MELESDSDLSTHIINIDLLFRGLPKIIENLEYMEKEEIRVKN